MLRPKHLVRVALAGSAVLFMTLCPARGAAGANQDRAAAESDGRDPSNRSKPASAAELEELRDQLKAVQEELRDVQAALKRIEAAVGKPQGPSEFSPVTVRLQSERGRPLAGFQVEMVSAVKGGRRAQATGRSDEDGLALSRELPYGDYHLTVRETSGWTTSFRSVTVEIGKPLELVVIAPDPRQRATLQIDSAIHPGNVQGLRFGERQERMGAGYAVPYSPEPGEEDSRFAAFPTLADGIDQVAVEIRVGIEREIEQPDGTTQTWRWTPERNLPRFLATTDGVFAINALESKSTRPEDNPRYFSKPDRPSKQYSIGYRKLDLQRLDESDASLEIAPGQVTVFITEILGKPDSRVLPSLGLDEQTDIWLEAPVLWKDSQWVPRILDLDGWERPKSAYLAKKTESVPPGDTLRITVKSPH